MFASSQAKNARSRMAPYLITSARPLASSRSGSVRETVRVDQHGARLMERADHVLSERVIDAGLPAHRRVDLRKQRRRHLHERHAALIDRRGETGEVADDAAAERDQRRRRVRPSVREGASARRESVAHVLCVSPSGTRIVSRSMSCAPQGSPGADPPKSARPRGLVTMTARGEGRSGATSAPARPRMPAPIHIG